MVAWEGKGGKVRRKREIEKRHMITFGADENFQYLDFGDSFI